MIDLLGEIRRIQNQSAAETFDRATDSLEAIRDFLTGMGQGLCFYGQIDAIPGANQFTVNNLIGLGNAKFAGANPYYVYVFRDAGGLGALPQGELRPVTAYVSATGTFTHAAFTAALVAGDEVLIIHPSLISGSLQFIAAGTLDTSSATVPADSTRTDGDNYFNGCILMTIEGAVAYRPARIVDYTGVGGIFTLDPGNPFPAASGAVLYVVLADTADFVPAADGALNRTTAEVVGNKADTAIYIPTNTAAIVRYLKGIMLTGSIAAEPANRLIESWQDLLIDANIWTVTDPATGIPWTPQVSGAFLYNIVTPNANEVCRMRGNHWWVQSWNTPNLNLVVKKLVMEFELMIGVPANLDNTLAFFGLLPSAVATRATQNIIGFGLAADVLQTITDSGGVETTNTAFGETLANHNKFRIEVIESAVRFYLNEVLIATHAANVPTVPMLPTFFYDTDAGGACALSHGIIRVWHEMVERY